MSFNVLATADFKRYSKRLIRKYRSLKDELLDLITSLEENPTQGTSIGSDCYKIRLAIKSKGKGKSGGARPREAYVIFDAVRIGRSVYSNFNLSRQDKNCVSLFSSISYRIGIPSSILSCSILAFFKPTLLLYFANKRTKLIRS